MARLAFADPDVTEQVSALRDRPGASELASALAAIVERSRPEGPFTGRGEVVVGAVVGAYASMRDAGAGDPAAATAAAMLGAVGGGTAASVGRFIQEEIAAVGVAEYLRTAERP